MNVPRGIRNNNPGNIDRGHATWKGMDEDQSGDSRFIVFESPEYGIRAIARLLKNYRAKGFDTVGEIINRWAPPVENDTSAYVDAVAAHVGINANDKVEDEHIPRLIEAIIKHENGQQPYTEEQIAKGIELERTA